MYMWYNKHHNKIYNFFVVVWGGGGGGGFTISQFVISEGAWNCGRKSGVSKVNCEKFESITVRARAVRLPHAVYSVHDCTTNDDSKRIASRRHLHD